MQTNKNTKKYQVTIEKGTKRKIDNQELIVEEPLSIRVDGKPYSVIMRTPGNEIHHAAGFCLAEGLVDSPDDFSTIGFCTEEGVNVVTVNLTSERRNTVEKLINRRGFFSQTSCGICGKELLSDMSQIVRPLASGINMTIERAKFCFSQLIEHQALYKKTFGSHAAMIFDSNCRVMSYAEDVGRHNAMDKAVGKVLMDRKIEDAHIVVVSSRSSFELIQKAARAQLEIMISMSRPTSLALDLAKSLNMTLVCMNEKRGFITYCGDERFHT